MPGRLEFNMGETPIPVIKGTNYAKAFADSEAVRKRIEAAKAASSSQQIGPYSSLFDYNKEMGDLETMQGKRQETQKKIMRTNALGDVFRLLIETVGASGGATITARQPNPYLLNAYNEYAKNDIDYINRLEGIKTKKLALGQADLQYNLGQNALALEKAEKQAERSHQEAMQAEKELNLYIKELQLQASQYRLQGLNDKAKAAEQKANLGTQALLEIEVARKKAQFDRGIDLVPGQTGVGVNILTPPEKKGDAMEFIIPDTGQKIYLTPGLVNYIATQLSVGKGPYDQTVPRVLRDIMANKNPQPEALAKAFTDNWDYIRDEILAPVPDLAAQLKIAPVQKATPGTAPASTTQQTTIPAGQEELQQKIHNNLTSDPELDLENDRSVKKKIGEIADIIYANYLLQPGNKKNRNDAITEANNIISRYRKLSRGKVE